VDAAQAWSWFERIPATERARFPRLAYYEAERALARGRTGVELRAPLAALERYRDTEEGRRLPGIDALLARLARALGDTRAARAYQDADRRQRGLRAAPLPARAASELREGRLDACEGTLAELVALLPGDPRALELRARLALARNDAAGLAAALRELRHSAPTLAAAVAAENRFRAAHDLPLLPERTAAELIRATP
jgi:hypothetical protein